ncbi:MAG: DPP IV N-terminal domain-containing protein [Planctomycetota bacterium]
MKDHNVWLRSATDDTMVQLTTDGIEGYEYAPLVADSGFPWLSSDNSFSPDSSKLAVKKIDYRKTPRLPLVHWLSPSRHVEFTRHMTADGPMNQNELFIVDIVSRRNIRIDTGKEPDQRIIMHPGWQPNGSEFVFFRTNRSLEKIDLMATNPDSGSSRVILTTTGKEVLQFKGLLSLTILSDGERFMMLSERDGWNHLYLYDLQGNLIRQLTKGNFPVLRIVTIDEKAGWIYFTAHTDRQRPYDTHLCRVNLEGHGFKCLTEATGVHDVRFSPSKRFFLDTHSTIARPPVVELRSADGKLLRTLSKADIEALMELNWIPPEQFVVKAADGKTDLYGVLWKPYDFDPKKSYPVIEGIYGLIRTDVPHDFGGGHSKQELAQLGFIVFVVDARGTGERGRAFGEANLRGLQLIPDHVAALQQLGAERPYMDLSRVGIYGASAGGYATIRALLTAPDVYHVGVASSPLVDVEDIELGTRYIGLFHENKGAFEDASNSRLAGNLKGKLLLAHGTSDLRTPFWGVMRLVDALARAGKPYDLIVQPEVGHYLVSEFGNYVMEARRRYFQEHLKPVPTVEITRPAEGSYDIGEPVPLKARATTSADARVLRVEFLIDGVSIGVDPEPPYEFKWPEAKKGRHILSAKVYDSTGRIEPSRPVTVYIGTRALERPVSRSIDDAEEFADGSMHLKSTDLELINDSQNSERSDQVVGMRFTDIPIPQGAQIRKAYLQFMTDEVKTKPTNLVIHAETAPYARPFTKAAHNISSRKRTKASVKWSPEPWNVIGERSEKQRTPDLSAIIQEVIAQPEWQEGSSLVFVITGSGERCAVSYEGDQQNAPVLYVEY